MEIYGIQFSKGSLGKNLGCRLASSRINEIIPVKDISVFQDNIEKTNESIVNRLKDVKNAIIIGGDHSITYPCFKAFVGNNKNYGLIVFDAHPDCVAFSKFPSHEDYLRTLIDEEVLDGSRVILIGIRSASKEELDYLHSKKIVYFDMRKIMDLGVQEICDLVMERVNSWPGVYLSIDIDAVDPSCAPGTGYIEPGGLLSRELLYFVSRLKFLRNLGMIDIVEINPEKDINNLTTSLGVKIIGEVLNETFYCN